MARISNLLCVVLIASMPLVTVAQEREGVEVGPVEYFTLTDSPFSGPVETLVFSDHPTVGRGTGSDVFLVVQNHSNEGTVSVNIDLDLEWSDGSVKRPFHLGGERSHILGPNEGVGFIVFFAIPVDAPLGTAEFRANARVGRVTNDDDGHADNPNPMVATDFAVFEVVP